MAPDTLRVISVGAYQVPLKYFWTDWDTLPMPEVRFLSDIMMSSLLYSLFIVFANTIKCFFYIIYIGNI